MEIEKQAGEIIMTCILWIMVMIALLPAISDNALRITRPEIFNQKRENEKALNRMRRELNKALSENTKLKKQMKQFTYTQPKTDHNVYIKKLKSPEI